MNIGPEEVARIAALAGLELSTEEFETMAAELSKILEYVDQLHDLEGPTPASVKGEAGTPLRDDVPGASLDRAIVERNAPAWQDGFFVVPRVLGGE